MNESAVHSTSGFLPWLEFGDFRIQTYFVVISLVLCICAVWIPKRAEARGRSPRLALDLFLVAMVGGFVGARLLHIFWEEPAYYFEAPLRVFDVMSGGFVWYGGAIGAALSIWSWLRFRNEKSLLEWLDFFAPVAAIGYAGGRLACVLTGCCFGMVCIWPFHQHESQNIFFRFPTQSFAVISELAITALLLWLEKKSERRSKKNGRVFFSWLLMHGISRIAMESLRADPRGPNIGPVTISLVLSLVFVATAMLGLLHKKREN